MGTTHADGFLTDALDLSFLLLYIEPVKSLGWGIGIVVLIIDIRLIPPMTLISQESLSIKKVS